MKVLQVVEKTLNGKEPYLVEQFITDMQNVSEQESATEKESTADQDTSTDEKTAAKKETVTPGMLRLLEFGLNFPWRFKNWLPKYDYDLGTNFGEIKEVFQRKCN